MLTVNGHEGDEVKTTDRRTPSVGGGEDRDSIPAAGNGSWQPLRRQWGPFPKAECALASLPEFPAPFVHMSRERERERMFAADFFLGTRS